MPISQQSGFTFPMIQAGSQGHVNYVHNDSQRLIQDSVLQIVLTTPGERMYRPTFGCRVRKLTFEQLSPANASLIKSLIIEALTLWESRIKVSAKDITVTYVPDNSGNTQVAITYEVLNPDFTSSPFNSITLTL